MIVRLRALILIVVILLGAAAVSGQDVPSTISTALQQLSSLVGYPVTLQMLDAYTWESNYYPDTHLGCELAVFPAVSGNYFAYHFTLTLNAVAYDIRVSGDNSIVFPCIGDGGTSPLPGVTSVPAAELAPCPIGYEGYLRPRLRVGGQGSIEAGGTPNRIRSSPSVLAPQIGVIQPGSTVTVLAGPSCEPQSVNGQANIIFWQVNAGGVIGWTAEGLLPDDYFIEAIGGSGSGSLPTERTVISPENAAALDVLTTIQVPGLAAIDIAEDNGGVLYTAGSTNAVSYDLVTWQMIDSISNYPNAIAVAVSDDGMYAAFGFCDGRFSLLNRTTNQSVTLQFPGGGCVSDLDYSSAPDPILAIGMNINNTSGQLALVRASAPAQSAVFYNVATTFPVASVAFSPDGSTITYLDDQVHVLDTATQATVNTIPIEALNSIDSLRYVPLTALAAPQVIGFGEGNVVRVVNLTQSNEMRFDLVDPLYPVGIAFSPDARIMAVVGVPINPGPGSASVLSLFDLQTGDVIMESFLPAEPNGVAFTPDGTVLITIFVNELSLWGIP